MIRILIAEDQQMLRGAFASLLNLEDDFEVIAEVADGVAAWETIKATRPSVCLLDIEMPKLDGLTLATNIKEVGLPTKVMIVTTFARPGFLQKAIDAQVDGYVLKDEPIDFLIAAIRRVVRGEQVMSADLVTSLFQAERNPLTKREIEVLNSADKGKTTKEIAEDLFLTYGTVRNYLSSAIQKLEVTSRQQAVDLAKEKGWLS